MKRIESLPDPSLEVRDLRLILALCAAGTTKAAGALLHLAQPSVSRALLSAEERLGVELFFRTPKGLEATPECRRLADGAEALLGGWLELEQEARGRARVERVRVVSECHTAYHWLPSALTALREGAQEARLTLRLECTERAPEALLQGEVDAALLTTPFSESREFQVEHLFADEILFVLGENHPLASRKFLTPKHLSSTPLFCARSPSAERKWFMSSVFGRGTPQVDMTWVPLTEAIIGVVRAGHGIGILTEWVLKSTKVGKGTGLVVKRLRGKTLRRQWRLAWSRSIGAAGPLLAAELRAWEGAIPGVSTGPQLRGKI